MIQVIKRDGSLVWYDRLKIYKAFEACYSSIYTELDPFVIEDLTLQSESKITSLIGNDGKIEVEKIQDINEDILLSNNFREMAKAYIRYREDRNISRHIVPHEIKEHFRLSDPYFKSQLQKFIFYDKYSRFNYEKGIRETWEDTVNRAVEYLRKLSDNKFEDSLYRQMKTDILNMNVLPSMRLLSMAGEAADRNNISIYNCSYLPIMDFRSFSEVMYISMSGCGVGFSVEKKYVEKLPIVKPQSNKKGDVSKQVYNIEDSSEGWADALMVGIEKWFNGEDISFNYQNIRKAGSILKIKGGRACLGGDTVVVVADKDNKKLLNRSLEELFYEGIDKDTKSYTPSIDLIGDGKLYFNEIRGIYEINLGGGDMFGGVFYLETSIHKKSIVCTGDHRFFDGDFNHKKAQDFKKGDKIKLVVDFDIVDDVIEYIKEEENIPENVYDMEVESPNHNYVANSFLSSNSGPDPLRSVLEYVREKILSRQGLSLRTIDVYDIVCKIGECVVSGGVRRTAMICLFDFDDTDMLNCKSGNYSYDNKHRWNSNNSAVFPDKRLDQIEVVSFMERMFREKNGEPGIFIRRNLKNHAPERRKRVEFGVNPCSEIVLRPYQFCNLTSAIIREDDTLNSLVQKVEMATIIGTIQSMATNFPYIRDDWRINCDEERLLGVDLNGQMDNPSLIDELNLKILRQHATNTNIEAAKILGINQSASVTCVKPSGNSGLLINSSSGLHPRWSKYYKRNVRIGTTSALYKIFKDANFPMSPENGQQESDAITWVLHFPVKSPETCIVKDNVSAISQCEFWKLNKLYWTDHNPSVTISYKNDEVIDLIKWIYDNQDIIGGMTFLPSSDHVYKNAPYEEISEDEYRDLMSITPTVDFFNLYYYEKEDHTSVAKELACSSGSCEL